MNLTLTPQQYAALLEPLPQAYVSTRSISGRRLSYVEAWHVKRTLTRIFGFGGWSSEVISCEHAFTRDVAIGSDGKSGFQVGYKSVVRLSVSAGGGTVSHTEAAVGFASLTDLGEAHDMACKTSESDALKRCAINLGDQFGLSLYNNGGLSPVVCSTLVPPAGADGGPAPERPAVSGLPESLPDSDEARMWVDRMGVLVNTADVAGLVSLRTDASQEDALDLVYQGETVARWFDKAIMRAGKGAE